MLADVAGRTIDVDLLTGGWVLDGGCRDWLFADAMLQLGEHVVGVDPAQDIRGHRGAKFHRAALMPYCGLAELPHDDDPQTARAESWTGGLRVPAVTVDSLRGRYAVEVWDVVKLNIEGGEYAILQAWPGPIARQISVAFHDFLGRNPCPDPESYYGPMLEHLGQWYRVAQHEKTHKDDELDYWDSLFILKDTHAGSR